MREALRRQRGWLIASGICLVLAGIVHPWDHQISGVVYAKPSWVGEPLAEFFLLFQPFGKADVLLLGALAFGFLGFRRRVLEVLVALLLMGLLVTPTKYLVGRERPGGDARVSFPSGDAAAAASVAVPLMARLPVAAPAVVGLVAITPGVYGRHYPSDVLAGIGFGLLAGAAARELVRRVHLRLRLRRFVWLFAALVAAAAVCAAFSQRGVDMRRLLLWYGPALILPVAVRLARLGLRRSAGMARLERLAARDRLWLGRGFRALAPVGLALGLGLLIAPWWLPLDDARGVCWALGLLILVMAALVRRQQRAGRYGAAAVVMLAGMVILQFYAVLVAVPALEDLKLSSRRAAEIRARTGPEAPSRSSR